MLLQKKPHTHLVLNKRLFSLRQNKEMLDFICDKWKKVWNKESYSIFFLELIHSMRWRYNYVV